VSPTLPSLVGLAQPQHQTETVCVTLVKSHIIMTTDHDDLDDDVVQLTQSRGTYPLFRLIMCPFYITPATSSPDHHACHDTTSMYVQMPGASGKTCVQGIHNSPLSRTLGFLRALVAILRGLLGYSYWTAAI
jgi:hypothetical protein